MLFWGIGVNLNMRADQFPADLRYPATSLAINTGELVSRLDFTRALLQEIDALYHIPTWNRVVRRASLPGQISVTWRVNWFRWIATNCRLKGR